MSLEAALAENTAALIKVAGLLEASNAGREAAISAITDGAAAPVGRPRKTAEQRAAEKAAAEASKTPAPPPPAETAQPDVDDLRGAAVTFVSVDEAAKPERKAFLKAVTEHLGIEKIVDARPEDRAQVIAWLRAKGRGEAVNFSDGEDETPAEDNDDIG